MKYEYEFGNRVYEARKKAKMNQTELAQAVGVSQNSISGWESGRRIPCIYNAKNLAKALNVSLDWLATGEGTI